MQNEQWEELVREVDYDRALRLANPLRDGLQRQDVEWLVSVFVESAQGPEGWAASGLLLPMLDSRDERFPEEARVRFVATAEALARSDYPHGDQHAGRCMAILRAGDRPKWEALLLSLEPGEEWTHRALYSYFSNLELMGNEAAVARLQELEQRGGDLGQRAHDALGRRGRWRPEQVEELASKFRSQHTTAQLNKLFNFYVRFMVGRPLKEVRDRLGPPTREEERCLTYETERPFAVIKIFFNEAGVVTDFWHR
jgi:hypothetical protein